MISPIARISLGAACLLASVGLAACGSSSDSSSTTSVSSAPTDTSTAASSSSGGAAEVDVDNNAKLGDILVDAKGNTLYLFKADKSDTSTCNGACAQTWPPYTTDGNPTAGSGADSSLLGTSKREDGTIEVTYAGHPLYYYAGDKQPGDTTGNDVDQFGAEWYALTPKGETPEDGGAS